MMWQDYAIAVIGFLFAVMLLPQIGSSFRGRHVNPWSSGLTSLGLFSLSLIMLTLGLPLAATANGLTGLAWALIFGLRLVREES